MPTPLLPLPPPSLSLSLFLSSPPRPFLPPLIDRFPCHDPLTTVHGRKASCEPPRFTGATEAERSAVGRQPPVSGFGFPSAATSGLSQAGQDRAELPLCSGVSREWEQRGLLTLLLLSFGQRCCKLRDAQHTKTEWR